MDLSFLQTLEREKILQVLQRDRMLRTMEEERIRRMKQELQDIRRRGAKSFSRQYSERTCARCQRPLGKFWNSGDVCRGCSHRICSRCRVGRCAPTHAAIAEWRCTVCHAYRDVKVRSGEWFLEERAKKFPITTGRHDTVGEKLLKSYNMPSNISIVPPTPPPYLDRSVLSRSGDSSLSHSTFFTRSVEDLMVSFTSHIKKISKSQNDVHTEQADRLTVGSPRPSPATHYSGQKSLSDTDIKSLKLTRGHSLGSLLLWSDREGLSPPGAQDHLDLWTSGTCSRKRGSSSGIASLNFLASDSDRNVTGDLELALAYHDITSCLQVTVRGCQNVSYGNTKKKKCNPYVKIYLVTAKAQASKRKTSVKRNTTNPVYNEVLEYQVERPLLSGCTLRASVWHSGSLKRNVFLGETSISLEGWSPEQTAAAWYPLGSKGPVRPGGGTVEQGKAELRVSLKLGPTSKPSAICPPHGLDIGSQDYLRLTVLIKGAKNLPMRANTSQNIDVKGCLTLSRGRKVVSSAHGACSDSAPLLFDGLLRSELADSVLVLDVWDRAHLALTDRPLGGVRLDANNIGLPWQTVLKTPYKWHEFSLPLVPSLSFRRK